MSDPLFAVLAPFPQLACALSRRTDGTMTIAGEAARKLEGVENFRRFFTTLGLSADSAVRCQQAHGKTVAAVAAKDRGTVVRAADGLVTATPQTFLTVTVGDCLPLYFFDPRRRAVGLVHAGWRSLQQGIVAVAVSQLTDRYGCQPSDVLVAIGPGLGPCHFTVSPAVAEQFAAYPSALVKVGQLTVDLKAVAAAQLQAVGVRRQHIEIHPDCTACQPERYFSFRRDRPPAVEAMVAVIGLR